MPLVILDRDGVINYDSDAYIKSPEEWVPIPGSLAAIAKLHRAGFTVTVATNQAGIARGLLNAATLDAIHHKMQAAIEQSGGKIDGIFTCPHAPWESCDCRKPKPGLFRQIAESFHVDLRDVPVIGDSLRDIEAAESVGARAMLVCSGNGEITLKNLADPHSVEVFTNLADAADQLIRELQS